MIGAKKFPQYQLAPRAQRPRPPQIGDPFKARDWRSRYKQCDPEARYRAHEVAGRLKVNRRFIDYWVHYGYLRPEVKPIGSTNPHVFLGSEVNAFISRIRFPRVHYLPGSYPSRAKLTDEEYHAERSRSGSLGNVVRWTRYREEKAARALLLAAAPERME